MDEQSQHHPVERRKGGTAHHVVDRRFAELLSSDFSIPTPPILRALEGEPQKAAIEVTLWAAEQTSDPAGALLSRARKHGTGAFRRTPRRRNMTPAQTRAALDVRAEVA